MYLSKTHKPQVSLEEFVLEVNKNKESYMLFSGAISDKQEKFLTKLRKADLFRLKSLISMEMASIESKLATFYD